MFRISGVVLLRSRTSPRRWFGLCAHERIADVKGLPSRPALLPEFGAPSHRSGRDSWVSSNGLDRLHRKGASKWEQISGAARHSDIPSPCCGR